MNDHATQDPFSPTGHACPVGYPIAWSAVTSRNEKTPRRRELDDLTIWLVLSVIGLAAAWFTVAQHARFGFQAAPFAGRYRLALGPATPLAPVVAALVLLASVRAVLDRYRFGVLQVAAYLAGLSWSLSLAAVAGTAGLSRALTGTFGGFAGDARGVDHPLDFLRGFIARSAHYSPATRGHPPGPVLLLAGLDRLGITGTAAVGLLLTAVGALFVPLTVAAVRSVCGEEPARRYTPVLALAPYAVFLAGSMDAVVAALGAAMIAAGARASETDRRGWSCAGWAALAGLLLGLAALFSYAAPWLGLALVFLYFARRRPFLNLATGIGALAVPVLAAALGFSWFAGLTAAHAGYSAQVTASLAAPYRSILVWVPISLLALLVTSGPAFVASMRKVRNTPGWPFLAGAGIAVTFSLLAGLARGGVQTAWLPFFGWLSVGATAPEWQAGPPVRTPMILTAAGALVAIVLAAVLRPT
jgi:methylthioxylose transferase